MYITKYGITLVSSLLKVQEIYFGFSLKMQAILKWPLRYFSNLPADVRCRKIRGISLLVLEMVQRLDYTCSNSWSHMPAKSLKPLLGVKRLKARGGGGG